MLATKALNQFIDKLCDIIIQCASTSWLSRWWCAEAARTWCWCCLWTGLCGWAWASATRVLLRKWGDVFCVVSLRPTLTFSSAGESRSHRICEKKQSVCHLKSTSPKTFNTNLGKKPDLHRSKMNMRVISWCKHASQCPYLSYFT